jgi:hypothetical protein
MSRFADNQGRICRRYVQTATINGRSVEASAFVCKQPNDTWHVIAPAFTNISVNAAARR